MKRMLKRTLAAVMSLTVITGGLPGAVGSVELVKTAYAAASGTVQKKVPAVGVTFVWNEKFNNLKDAYYGYRYALAFDKNNWNNWDEEADRGYIDNNRVDDVCSFYLGGYDDESGMWMIGSMMPTNFVGKIAPPAERHFEYPIGLKIVSGTGTVVVNPTTGEETPDPFKFELVYEGDPIPLETDVAVGKKWFIGETISTDAYFSVVHAAWDTHSTNFQSDVVHLANTKLPAFESVTVDNIQSDPITLNGQILTNENHYFQFDNVTTGVWYQSETAPIQSHFFDISYIGSCEGVIGLTICAGEGTEKNPFFLIPLYDSPECAALTENECQAVTDSAAPAVSVGFSAEIMPGWDLLEYGILYYNSGNVIHTEHLTLDNVGVCGIQKIHGWNAEIADLGYGVTAVGYIKAIDVTGYETVMYTGELGGKYSELKPVTLTRLDNKVVTSNGKNKISVGFKADIPEGSTVEEYGLLYYNSGNVIHTEHLILENDGVCGIKKANYWSANITDNGYGVVCVGFVTVTDKKGNVTTYYTEELGNGVNAMAEVANKVTLTKRANKAVTSSGKNKVYAGFDATLPTGYSVEDYGLIYYNSGNVIHTEHLTLENVGVCGIQKAKYWGANITDNGYGVVCVGFVKVKAPNGYVTTLYTGELGNSFTAVSEAAAANAVTLTKQANKAVTSGGKNKVYCGFTANTAAGYTVEDYGLIYYNSGNVIHTEHLTLNNVGVCGIQKAKYWGANITDNGYGVVCVGFVKVKDANGYVTTLYTGELGAKFAELPH